MLRDAIQQAVAEVARKEVPAIVREHLRQTLTQELAYMLRHDDEVRDLLTSEVQRTLPSVSSVVGSWAEEVLQDIKEIEPVLDALANRLETRLVARLLASASIEKEAPISEES